MSRSDNEIMAGAAEEIVRIVEGWFTPGSGIGTADALALIIVALKEKNLLFQDEQIAPAASRVLELSRYRH